MPASQGVESLYSLKTLGCYATLVMGDCVSRLNWHELKMAAVCTQAETFFRRKRTSLETGYVPVNHIPFLGFVFPHHRCCRHVGQVILFGTSETLPHSESLSTLRVLKMFWELISYPCKTRCQLFEFNNTGLTGNHKILLKTSKIAFLYVKKFGF